MRYFTHYWSGVTFRQTKELDYGRELSGLGSNQFLTRGVGIGDVVYVITYLTGDLHVAGRLLVDRIVSEAEARTILGTDDVWPADDQIIARRGSGTQLHFDLVLPDADLKQVEFIAADGSTVPPARNKHGQVDQQTFRGVHEITRRTAAMFDKYLGKAASPEAR